MGHPRIEVRQSPEREEAQGGGAIDEAAAAALIAGSARGRREALDGAVDLEEVLPVHEQLLPGGVADAVLGGGGRQSQDLDELAVRIAARRNACCLAGGDRLR